MNVTKVSLTVLLVLIGVSPSYATNMTGLTVFSTDEQGNHSPAHFVWNTAAFDTIWNLWVTDGDLGGPDLNGPGDHDSWIDVPLTDGSHLFTIIGEGEGPNQPFHGLNIFFNGANNVPGISVFSATDDSLFGPDPPFFPNGGITFPLESNDFPQVAGADSLVFIDGQTQVTLSSHRWSAPEVGNVNLVYQYSRPPGSGPDFIGQFTLEVTTIPEPSSFVLMCLGLVTLGCRRRHRAAQVCSVAPEIA